MSAAARLADVHRQIIAACEECGRDPGEVTLLAVSKTRPAADVRAAMAAGQRGFGENRVQELLRKADELAAEDLDWHMIGSVQTNKARDLVAVPRLTLLHSLDRAKLADRLQLALEDRGAELPVLLQVNATGEHQKHGVGVEDAGALADHVASACPRLLLRGVMAMGPLDGDPAPVFARAAGVRQELQARLGAELPVLSLGMTDDLRVAIAAVSTMVRVGTGVFGPRA